jgi:hypothetical protein
MEDVHAVRHMAQADHHDDCRQPVNSESSKIVAEHGSGA